MASSAAARPTSGCDPAPKPSVTCRPIWMMRSALELVSAWASVLATMKSTPTRPETIILLTALPPAPPTPQTMMRGFNSLSSGIFKLIVIAWPLVYSSRSHRPCFSMSPVSGRRRRRPENLETVLQPPADTVHVAVRSGRLQRNVTPRLEVFDARDLRVNQQSDTGRKGRALG